MRESALPEPSVVGRGAGDLGSAGQNTLFVSNHLVWPISRRSRAFVVRVVEPEMYQPAAHAGVFSSVISHLIQPEPDALDGFRNAQVESPIAFDLVTFPEAFAPADTFLGVLRFISRTGSPGCIHVGLRPDQSTRHLFQKSELIALIEGIETLPTTVLADLTDFKAWLLRQREEHRYNVAALFAVDADRHLRVCLYPKALRARVEHSAISDAHMEEADLLTLVTLEPIEKRFKSITLQPITCSDAFDYKTDRGTPGPIGALDDCAECFDQPPDHIDIVSVATCTRQVQTESAKGLLYREWHEDFRASFLRAAAQPGRHTFSTFVLSNFRMLDEREAGGLSGLFQPEPPPARHPHDDVVISAYGRPAKTKINNRWSTPDDDAANWSGRGYLAGLDPFGGPSTATVRILKFELTYLLRDQPRWSAPLSLARLDVSVGEPGEGGRLNFARRSDPHDN